MASLSVPFCNQSSLSSARYFTRAVVNSLEAQLICAESTYPIAEGSGVHTGASVSGIAAVVPRNGALTRLPLLSEE